MYVMIDGGLIGSNFEPFNFNNEKFTFTKWFKSQLNHNSKG